MSATSALFDTQTYTVSQTVSPQTLPNAQNNKAASTLTPDGYTQLCRWLCYTYLLSVPGELQLSVIIEFFLSAEVKRSEKSQMRLLTSVDNKGHTSEAI